MTLLWRAGAPNPGNGGNLAAAAAPSSTLFSCCYLHEEKQLHHPDCCTLSVQAGSSVIGGLTSTLGAARTLKNDPWIQTSSKAGMNLLSSSGRTQMCKKDEV
eukprot:3252712-Amphidinium_carterae.2